MDSSIQPKLGQEYQGALLEAMFEHATLGIIMINQDGTIIRSNPFISKMFGYDNDELNGQKIEALIPQNYHQKHIKHRNSYHKNPSPRLMGANLELFGQRKDGSQFPVEISLSHTTLKNEKLAIAYVNDYSEQKILLKELQKNRVRLNEAQAVGHVGNFEWNLKDNKLIWSDELYRMFGFEPQSFEMTFDKIYEIIHPDDLESTKKTIHKLKKKKSGVEYGYRIIRPNGEVRYIQVKRKFELNEHGEIVRLFGILSDITDLKNAESLNKDISKIMEESLNEVFIFDAETLNFIQVNIGARQNLGYSLKELKKLTPIDIKPNFTKDSFLKKVMPLIEGKKNNLVFQTLHLRKDQTTYPVEVHLQYSTFGKKSVFVAFILDITNRIKAEKQLQDYSNHLEDKVEARTEELLESQEKLLEALSKEQELSELKSRFVSMASHEFRTPLTTILSSSNLVKMHIERGNLDKYQKHINNIKSAVNNLTTILSDFLSLEKIESGKVKYSPNPINLVEFIPSVIEEVNLLTGSEQNINFILSDGNEAHIDEHLVRNILINLLSNAIKYSPNGEDIELSVDKKASNLIIKVKDKGIGIPEDQHKQMFSRFFRATNVSTIQGTGIGLTIVQRYLDIMKGSIRFESKINVGTTFIVEIPQ